MSFNMQIFRIRLCSALYAKASTSARFNLEYVFVFDSTYLIYRFDLKVRLCNSRELTNELDNENKENTNETKQTRIHQIAQRNISDVFHLRCGWWYDAGGCTHRWWRG